MVEPPEHQTSPLSAVSNALVALHKEQFGRGPTKARTHFAGPDAMVCVLEDVLLPAERKMAARGESQRVRETRTAFQVATAPDFIAAIECLVHRKVAAFASATDVERNVVFESFTFEPSSSTGDGDGLPESLDEPGTPRPPSRLELSSEQRRAMRWRADARAPSRWS